MKKEKFKTMKELYETSGQGVEHPEITQAMENSNQIKESEMLADEREICNTLLKMKRSVVTERGFIRSNRSASIETSYQDTCGDHKNSSKLAKKQDAVEPLLKCPDSDHGKASNAEEIDVNVCDICGDVGREDLLAICSNCSEGAEHTYCMRENLEKLPKGDWMCEECVISMAEKEKSRASNQPIVNKTKQTSQDQIPSRQKGSLKLGVKGSGLGISRLEIPSITKRKELENVKQSGISRPLSEMCRASSSKNLFNETLQRPRIVISSNEKFSSHTFRRASRSPTVQPRHQLSIGSATKSMLSKGSPAKVKPLSKDRILKQKFERQMGPNSSSKEVSGAMKSRPTNKASSDRNNACDSKVMSCDSSFSHAKEQMSVETECVSDLHNPIVCPPAVDSNIGDLFSICVLPQIDDIWRGEFIIRNGGKLVTCGKNFQAHLSTLTSPKVREVVEKFPEKMTLEEKPRRDIWPMQFSKNHATEDNIALYFFATDVESYEMSYNNVLNHLMKNDLGLKRTFGEIDLLIFASNCLHEKSQRWNKMFYLWGVFRGKDGKQSLCMLISQKASVDDDKNRPHQDSSNASISVSQNLCSSPRSCGSFSASFASCNELQTPKSSITLEPPAADKSTVDVSGSKESSPGSKCVDLQTNSDQETSVYSAKNDQLFGGVSHAGPAEREERESKRPRIAESCLEGNENPTCKRLKIFYNGVDENNNAKSVMFPGIPFSVGPNSRVSHFLPENIPFGPFDAMPISATSIKESPSQSELIDSNLELSLGVKERSAEQLTLPLFESPNSVNSQGRDFQSVPSRSGDINDSFTPLSLSLGFPFSGKEEALDLGLQWKGDVGVNTKLSL